MTSLDAEKLSLQWNEFQMNQVDSYRRMRLATDFSDVTLACENGRQIYAHRVILASSSSFFQGVLTKLMHSHPLIFLRGVPHSQLSAIVDFIYLGQAEVQQKDLDAFLEVAGGLGVKGLTEKGKDGIPSSVEGNILEKTPHEDEISQLMGDPLKLTVFKCDECGKTYSTKGSLRTHRYMHNKENRKKSEVSSQVEKGNQELGAKDGKRCDVNILEQNRNTGTEERDGGLHLSSMAENIAGTPTVCINETDQLIQNTLNLAAFKCDECGKTYSTKASLSTHKWIHRKKKLKSSGDISQVKKGKQVLGAKKGTGGNGNISEQNGNTVMEVENENIPPKEGHLEEILTEVEDIIEREASEYKGSPVRSEGDKRVGQGCLVKDPQPAQLGADELFESSTSRSESSFSKTFLPNLSWTPPGAAEPMLDVAAAVSDGLGDLDNSAAVESGQNIELEARIDGLSEQREGIWHCLQCGKKDRSRFHLRRHAETHIEGFSHLCQFCEKEFPQRAALKTHKLKVHPEHRVVKPFNCDLCNHASTSLNALKFHKIRMHKI